MVCAQIEFDDKIKEKDAEEILRKWKRERTIKKGYVNYPSLSSGHCMD